MAQSSTVRKLAKKELPFDVCDVTEMREVCIDLSKLRKKHLNIEKWWCIFKMFGV